MQAVVEYANKHYQKTAVIGFFTGGRQQYYRGIQDGGD